MMKLRLVFLMISSCTLMYHVTCNVGVYRIPETRSNVDVKSIVPACFMESVDNYIKQSGYQIAKEGQTHPNENRQIFKLVVYKILDETLNVLGKFTVLVVAMIERNKTATSLEFILDYIGQKMSKLSRCLEFLFNNKAEVSDLLTGYIFYSDFKYIFKTYYGEYYTYNNIGNVMSVRIKGQQWLEYLQRVPAEETYQQLYTEVEQSLEDISKTYQHLVGRSNEWLSPQCLKWRHLFESNSMVVDYFKVTVIDNENLYNHYLQIARETNSVKVMNFYVNVGKALDNIVLQMATDMTNSLLNLILRLIVDLSTRDNSFTQLNLAYQLVDTFLTSVIHFENRMTYGKRLKSSTQLLSSPAIKVLEDYINYCKNFNAITFPNTEVPFLEQLEKSFKKHVPGIVLDLPMITKKLVQDGSTQINIIGNMERITKGINVMLDDTSTK
ncbi:uncharacterized protein LOC126839523 [Adelges cooleyi]|uniref:uncharacterized protein LOC126839523 n=1 Tax=Adelges cooleyi TaxID=133065 RepID=UPI00217F66C1|nr:uncharacterized protein LOC126839523 [Adelges cooleyi]